MGKGKPHKKHPHSAAKGKNKQHDDKIPKGEKTNQENVIPDKNQEDDACKETQGNIISDKNQVGDANKENQENGIIEENQESKKYAKRKIVSNWSRYDEPEVVDEHLAVEEPYDETKDFEYIKLNATSASSHFKFKEEKEWGTVLPSVTNESKGILGLDLIELAADLKTYGLVEKLGLNKLLKEDCKYCIKDTYKSSPNPSGKTSNEPEPVDILQDVTWSYDGIEQYEHLIGATEKNQEKKLINKIEINKSKPRSDNIQSKSNYEDVNNSLINIVKDYGDTVDQNTICHLSTSLDSKRDDDILDELLMDNVFSNDMKSSQNDTKNVSNDLKDFSNDSIDLPIHHHVISDNNSVIKENEEPLFKNDDSKSKANENDNTKSNEEELDLDMFLEIDIMSSGGECDVKETSNNDEENDDDLDQWLDDMLI